MLLPVLRAMVCLLFALALPAQPLQIYSEFRRVDAKGQIVKQDLGGKPREILSPGMIRNSYHSIRVVMFPPKDKWYTLQVSQNPENAFGITLYRELPGAAGTARDRLERVQLPVQGKGGGPESFWLDVWVPSLAPVRRVRLDVLLHDGEGWVTAPMEVRVLPGIATQVKSTGVALPMVLESSDATARQAMREYVCDEKGRVVLAGLTVRDYIRRNAIQDVGIARALQTNWTTEKLRAAMVEAAGGESVESWCGTPKASADGPEWYLKVRDFLYREASR